MTKFIADGKIVYQRVWWEMRCHGFRQQLNTTSLIVWSIWAGDHG